METRGFCLGWQPTAKVGEWVSAKNGAAMSGWIPTSSTGEVARGWRLGRHGKVGNSIEASQGGVAHRRGALDGGGQSSARRLLVLL
jgi:hypothetical protein